jgi:hypothetical protein
MQGMSGAYGLPKALVKKWVPFPLICLGLLAGCTPSIHDVVAGGTVEQAEAMLQSRPELVQARNKAEQRTPLHYAVRNARLDMMPLLVAHGADVDAQDITGMTPLHIAAWMGLREEAMWLLDQGAALEPRDHFGDTPMHTAAIFHGGLIWPLRSRGADLQAQNHEGATPLELARRNGNERAAAEIARRLRR